MIFPDERGTIHIFPNGISAKVNVMNQTKFELVSLISHSGSLSITQLAHLLNGQNIYSGKSNVRYYFSYFLDKT